MALQPSLFYQEKFEELLAELGEIQSPSMQETHNLAIAKFLADGDNPIPMLLPLMEQIRKETPDEQWPLHPSWNLLNYHVCLCQFYRSNFEECGRLLNEIWKNAESLNELIKLCISLLTVEVAIKTGDETNLEAAQHFLAERLRNKTALIAFLKEKIGEEKWIQKMVEHIESTELKIEVARAVRSGSEKRLRSIVTNFDKSKPHSVSETVAATEAAFSLDDNDAFSAILETADDKTHFAILNNRGLRELKEQRYSTALLHFSKALSTRRNTAIVHPYEQVIYNIGLCLLMKKRTQDAFRFFHSIIPMMPCNPYLWLRLAECCILFYRQRVDQLRKETQLSPVIAQQFATANRTFIILPQSDYELFQRYPLQGDGYIKDLNLDFAQRCTRNCISVCADNPKLDSVKRSAQLLCAVVSLELGDGERAAEMGKAAGERQRDQQFDEQQFYSKIVSAQGCAMAGNVSEARTVLNKLKAEFIAILKKDTKEYQHMFDLTFAVVQLLSDDSESKAYEILSRARKDSPEYVLTQVAIDLTTGKVDKAVEALRSFDKKT